MRSRLILGGMAVLCTATVWASPGVDNPYVVDRLMAEEMEIKHEISFVPLAPEGGLRATGDDCTDPLLISIPAALPYTDAGQTTCGRGNNYADTCMGYYDGGEDIIYELNVTADTCLNITVQATQTYLGVGVAAACPLPAGTCLGFGSSGGGTTATIQNLTLTAGTYYMMVDTWPSPTCLSNFTLTITECPAGGACCDGDTGDCTDVADAAECAATYTNGNYQGDGTECATTICPLPPVDCTNPTPVTDAFSVLDDSTCGRLNSYADTCLGSYDGGEDMIYEWTVTADGCYDVLLDPKGTTYTGVALDDVCPLDVGLTDCLYKSTNFSSTPHGFRANLTAGTYYIMVDTYPAPNCIPSFDLTAVPCPTLGACCKTDGTCEDLTEAGCLADPDYLVFAGLGTECASTDCTGACCYYDGSCTDGSQADCVAAGGTWQGIGTDCATTSCPLPPVDCTNPTPVTDAFSVLDDSTCGRQNSYADTCLGSYDGGEDMIYEWTITVDGCYDVLLDPKGTTWTGVALDDVCPLDVGADDCLYKSTTSGGAAHGFRANLTAGTYYIMVDTYPSPNCIPAFDLTATPCPVLGACCKLDGTCEDLTEGDCLADPNYHSFEGLGTECATTVCTGACCKTDGTCDDLTEAVCLAEPDYLAFAGQGSECATTVCTGACCYVGGACTDGSQADCIAAGGFWTGIGTDCATTTCPLDPVDCTNPTPLTDAFSVLDDTTCNRGNFYADTCLGYYDGGEDMLYEWTVTVDGCYDVLLDPKGTTYTGVALDSVCPLDAGPDDCLYKSTMSGSTPHGFRAVLTAGTYYIMVDTWPSPACIPSFDLTAVPCPTHGACCKLDGTCEDLTEAECLADPNYHSFEGLGTECATTVCTGACCKTDGTCEDLTEAVCLADPDYYSFEGQGTECATTICTGACCYDDGSCTDGTEADCVGAGGTWQGLGTECATTVCPMPPVDCTNPTPVTDAFSVLDDSTCGRLNSYADTCLGSYDGGEDMIYEWTVTADGCYDVLLDPKGTTWTGIAIDDVCPLDVGLTDCLYKSTMSSGTPHGFRASLTAGTYYIMVDTYPAPNCIPSFDLSAAPCPTGACCANDACSILDQLTCEGGGGLYLGDNTVCGPDCDNDGNPDACEIALGAPDCQPNGIPDSCDVAPGGGSEDCQPNGIPDECELGDPIAYFSESFEGTFPPAGWENTALEINGPWIVSTNLDYVQTGAQSAVHPWSADYDADSYLVTPELTLSDGILSVWSIGCFGQAWCDDYDIDVWYVVGAIGGGDDVYLGNLNALWTDSYTTWKEFTYDLSTVADGSPFRIGFQYTGFDADLGVIDDVTILPPGTAPLSNDCNLNDIPDDCDAKGDMNGDGTVDLADYPAFEACLAGPGAPMPACCGLADMDDDNDCDLDDFALYQQAF